MLSFKSLLVVALTATSVAADYASVLAKLKNPVDAVDLPDLKAKINAYPGSSAGTALLNIQNSNKQLIKDIDAVTTDAKGSTVPSATQGQSVLDYVGGTLLTDTKSVLVALDNKKASIIANGGKSATKTELQKTKTSVDNLANALIAKAPTPSQSSAGVAIKAKYDSEFDSRINAFS